MITITSLILVLVIILAVTLFGLVLLVVYQLGRAKRPSSTINFGRHRR